MHYFEVYKLYNIARFNIIVIVATKNTKIHLKTRIEKIDWEIIKGLLRSVRCNAVWIALFLVRLQFQFRDCLFQSLNVIKGKI